MRHLQQLPQMFGVRQLVLPGDVANDDVDANNTKPKKMKHAHCCRAQAQKANKNDTTLLRAMFNVGEDKNSVVCVAIIKDIHAVGSRYRRE